MSVLDLLKQQKEHEKMMSDETEEAVEKNQVDLDMRNQWYPLFRSDELTKDKPYAEHILGDPIVFFRDENGQVVCLEDKCAHRSAPLSIGCVKSGKIECKYHGWVYDSKGNVVKIPALLKDRSIPGNAKSKIYPCAEFENLVWVWPGDVEKADHSLIFKGRPFLKEDEDKWAEFIFTESLDIDHSLMVENLLDPAHLPFTHNGTISKRSDATPLKMSLYPVTNGYGGKVSSENQKFKSHFNFIAPCHILLTAQIKENWIFMQVMHCVPTSPGNMKLVYRQYRNFFVSVDKIPGMHWYQRRMSLKIVYQDYELLHGQQERLDQGAKPWNSPIQVDRLPKVYRNWLIKSLQNEPYFKGYSKEVREQYNPAIPKIAQSQSPSSIFYSFFSLNAISTLLALTAIVLVIVKH